MNNQIEQQNLELLEQYFRDGCKWNCLQKLGVELEHFVIDRKNQKNVSYYGPDGIEELLEEWKEYYPGHECENGRLLGLYNNDYALSLEPAAQLEISMAPKESLRCIEKIYRNFSEAVRPSLERRGYELVTRGYRPFGRVDELDLIPKKRYEYMDAYFQESGTTGRNMMRGTAAAQVSISRRPSGLRKTRVSYNSLAHRTTWLRSDFMCGNRWERRNGIFISGII